MAMAHDPRQKLPDEDTEEARRFHVVAEETLSKDSDSIWQGLGKGEPTTAIQEWLKRRKVDPKVINEKRKQIRRELEAAPEQVRKVLAKLSLHHED